jgi:hypothetical protein
MFLGGTMAFQLNTFFTPAAVHSFLKYKKLNAKEEPNWLPRTDKVKKTLFSGRFDQ